MWRLSTSSLPLLPGECIMVFLLPILEVELLSFECELLKTVPLRFMVVMIGHFRDAKNLVFPHNFK